MNNLIIWDWHYKIFFNKGVLAEVNSFIEKLNSYERKVYLYIRDFFLSFYSVSQLVDAVEENPQDYRLFIEAAVGYKDKLISTPSLIVNALKKRIDLLPADSRKDILRLLDHSCVSKYTPDFSGYCHTVFGSLYDEIAAYALAYKSPQKIEHGRRLQQSDMIPLINRGLAEIATDSNVINRFGDFKIDKFDTEICTKAGYAEWWDRELLDGKTDKLILFNNSDSMYINDLKYTLIHEVYPGHGYFYNYLAHDSGRIFDHGAMALIEGWATFAEWNTLPSEYISQVRQNNCAFLAQCMSFSGDELAQNILTKKRALGFSYEESLRTVIYASQYIGFLESYYIGALWIELYLSKNQIKPMDFLNMLKNRNIGEFFSLW